ncbi:ATP--guanido phosphotransferase [Thermospira aquatica]|uniref:Phosphagen kinase C-terminal domain-containing protein n=1 Tax=Thermospira aquatica TaxID=2828656 RepID=A0AAX3BAY4_9SPIR|nr:hypothetical protein [Thermospira aquatica]URA09452.1 hypothetical protein KDW03_08115 [Thermospira aquatica]
MTYITLPVTLTEHNHSLDHMVWSSRVRFARNVEGRTFPWRMSEREAFELDDKLGTLLRELFPEALFFHTEDFESEELLRWYARRVISQNFIKQGRTFGFAKDGSWTMMLLEDDHLRLQSCEMGYRIPGMLERLILVLRQIEKYVDFAFDEEKGYLTSSLLNVGTGLRLSAMVNLWGLVSQKKIADLIEYANHMSYMVVNHIRDDSFAPLFYIFNYYSLGSSEQDMQHEFQRFLQHVWKLEQEARHETLSEEEERKICYLELKEVHEMEMLSYEEMVYYLCLLDVLIQQNILVFSERESLRRLIFTYSDD